MGEALFELTSGLVAPIARVASGDGVARAQEEVEGSEVGLGGRQGDASDAERAGVVLGGLQEALADALAALAEADSDGVDG